MNCYVKVYKVEESFILSRVDTKRGVEFWLYDYVYKGNLSIRAKTENDAFAEALLYYQKRLAYVEGKLETTNTIIEKCIKDLFVSGQDAPFPIDFPCGCDNL